MKILYVQKVKAFAGSEKYLIEIIPELIRKGFECELICVIQSRDLKKLTYFEETIIAKKIPYRRIINDSNISFSLLRKLNSITRKGQFDLIHLNLIHAELWFTLIKYLFRLKTKLVSTIHGFDEEFQAKNGFNPQKISSTRYVRILRFCEKKISNYFAVSEGLYNLVVEGKIIPKNKIEIINYGFDYPPQKTSKHIDNEIKTILVPGRIVPYKGQNFALEMLPKLHQLGVKAKIQIAGDAQGEFATELMELSKQLEIENYIEFLGHVSNIADYYESADLVILTSKSEGFGLVLLEAFNYEKPVITFDVPAFNTTIKHGLTGLITPCFNTDKLAENAARLINDPALSKQLTKNAKRDLLDYYSLKRMVDQTITFYNKAIM